MQQENRQALKVSRPETWVVFMVSAGVCLVAGLAALRSGRADWDALAALSHAFDVVHREPRFNLGLIGFVDPPLPALLYLPFCGITPSLATSGLACPILGALALAASAVLANAMLALAGLRALIRWPIIAALVLHPVTLSWAALGSPGIILAFALLGAACALMRWSHHENFRDLLTCSLFLTAALLTRYEAIWVVLTAAGYVAWRTSQKSDGWSRTEGTLIAFGLPLVYCAAVWVGANWAILGDPWHFWRETVASPGGPMSSPDTGTLVLWVAMLSCPLILGLLYHEVRGVSGKLPLGRPAAWMVLGAGLGALVSPAVHSALGADAWSRLTVLAGISSTVGCVLLGVVIAPYLRHGVRAGRRPLGGTLLLGILGVVVIIGFRGQGIALPTSTTGALTGKPAFAANVSSERLAARSIASCADPARKVYVLGGPGYTLSLFTGQPARTVLARNSQLGSLPLEAGDLIAFHGGHDEAAFSKALEAKYLQADLVDGEAGEWTVLRLRRPPEK